MVLLWLAPPVAQAADLSSVHARAALNALAAQSELLSKPGAPALPADQDAAVRQRITDTTKYWQDWIAGIRN